MLLTDRHTDRQTHGHENITFLAKVEFHDLIPSPNEVTLYD